MTSTTEQKFNSITDKLCDLSTTLYGYQKQGVMWMLNQEARGFGGILADDPGLGKTLQALSLVYSSPDDSSTLIVVPTSIIGQWRNT